MDSLTLTKCTTQYIKILEHILREFQIKKKCYSNGALDSPTCAELGLSQTTTVGGCCILEGTSQKKVHCTDLWVLPTVEGLNLLKESEISAPQSNLYWINFNSLYFYYNFCITHQQFVFGWHMMGFDECLGLFDHLLISIKTLIKKGFS